MVEVITEERVAGSYVDWPAVIAGAVIAAAISFVLLTAGGAIGLSLISAEQDSHATAAGWLAAFWVIAVPIGALLAGGYIAGRMRPAWAGLAEEVQFRDGTHGLLVWAVSIVFGAFLAVSAAGATLRAGAEGAGRAAELASTVSPSVDVMVRSSGTASNAGLLTEDQRSEIGRIVGRAAGAGALGEDDRKYLTQVVAQRAGIPPQEAEKRVTDAYNSAVRSIESVRKGTVAAGLATATALLMGLVAAWFGAQRGGNHRDTNRPARFAGW